MGRIVYPFCENGRWTTEETLTEEQARACGLLAALKGNIP